MTILKEATQNMISGQMRACKVLNQKVLEAFERIPREDFVEASYKSLVLSESTVHLPTGDYMLPPMLEALMVQSLNLEGTENVLQIGAESGHITAVLSALSASVTVRDASQQACERLESKLKGLEGVKVTHHPNMNDAWLEKRTAVIVVGSMHRCPDQWIQCLSDGGRMVVIEGEVPAMEVVLIRNCQGHIVRTTLMETVMPRLQGISYKKAFTF